MPRQRQISLESIVEAIKPIVLQISNGADYHIWSDEALGVVLIRVGDAPIERILSREEVDLGLAHWRKFLRPRLEAAFKGLDS